MNGQPLSWTGEDLESDYAKERKKMVENNVFKSFGDKKKERVRIVIDDRGVKGGFPEV